jgi:hypothetical protein
VSHEGRVADGARRSNPDGFLEHYWRGLGLSALVEREPPMVVALGTSFSIVSATAGVGGAASSVGV